ncbi:uncharacterized protein SCHCODRAFT_01170256 [Schizophyllum commune H4-8]|nr:uncharacterized protein SCHCODRAFT_01170256 [Schizophyllum commune H4-8]KAI5896028.1 hypothetical protein SCHCODRAFT_01170256 [Schizophyllum commune H4-8]
MENPKAQPFAEILVLSIDHHPLHTRGHHLYLFLDVGDIISETLWSGLPLPRSSSFSQLRLGILGMLWRNTGANIEPQIYT